MASPILVGAPTQSGVNIFYVPPPQQPPNIFAAFASAFQQTRSPWARALFEARLRQATGETKQQMLNDLQKELGRLTELRVRSVESGELSGSEQIRGMSALLQAEGRELESKRATLRQNATNATKVLAERIGAGNISSDGDSVVSDVFDATQTAARRLADPSLSERQKESELQAMVRKLVPARDVLAANPEEIFGVQQQVGLLLAHLQGSSPDDVNDIRAAVSGALGLDVSAPDLEEIIPHAGEPNADRFISASNLLRDALTGLPEGGGTTTDTAVRTRGVEPDPQIDAAIDALKRRMAAIEAMPDQPLGGFFDPLPSGRPPKEKKAKGEKGERERKQRSIQLGRVTIDLGRQDEEPELEKIEERTLDNLLDTKPDSTAQELQKAAIRGEEPEKIEERTVEGLLAPKPRVQVKPKPVDLPQAAPVQVAPREAEFTGPLPEQAMDAEARRRRIQEVEALLKSAQLPPDVRKRAQDELRRLRLE